MASSSSASIHKSFKYDVFLSFRGEDTRTNFIDHLYDALNRKGICTYKDHEAIRKGERITDELMGSIEDSNLYIIVFSRNYASSSWCLDELMKIMECQKATEHTAYPVFYDVEPTEVRKQSGAVGEAFAKHENDESAGKWRDALTEAAGLTGWELKKTANGIDKKLVGMEPRVKYILSSLETDSDDVRMIGIWGMGGSGKTTLARVVFDQISFRFEGKSFVENVREVSNNPLLGLKSLQNQVLSNVLNDQMIKVDGIYDGIGMMKSNIHGQRVVLVLDDVDHLKQLEALAGELGWFKSGSRIIITTRDKQVLEAHGVKAILDVKLLSYEEQKCLFNTYAFKGEIPTQGFEELSKQVIYYAQGLPLTIKVLGSLLYGKKVKSEWRNTLERLKKIPLHETLKILELSYLSLEEDQKEIFLDVACMMKGRSEEDVIEALESCGFCAKDGLSVLEQKALITIDDKYGPKWVNMHDHIEEMGKNIVHRSHQKPQKRSRLWIDEEIKKILANDLGTKATRCILFRTEKVNSEFMKCFIKMKELRFLEVSLYDDIGRSPSKVNQCFPCFPDALQYLSWQRYPFMYLPKTFEADNLVKLDMASSKIVQLWEGGDKKVLNKLKFLDLSYSKLRTLDFGLIPNLEELSLHGCRNMLEFHLPDKCHKLIKVDLTYTNVKTVDLLSAVNLKLLYLGGCNALVELHLPDKCRKLIKVDLTYTKVKTVDLRSAINLELLYLVYCSVLVELHLPDECHKLTYLECTKSKLRTLDIALALNLEKLILRENRDLEKLQMHRQCQNLKSLELTESKLRTLDIALALNLEKLILHENRDLVELQMPGQCQNLRSIKLTKSKLRFLDIGLTPNLEDLDLSNCRALEVLKMANNPQKFKCLNIMHTKLRTIDIGQTSNLKKLDLEECELELGYFAMLHMVAMFLKRCPLHPDSTSRKFFFEYIYKDPVSLEKNIPFLSVGLCACTNLDTFSISICPLKPLNELILERYPEVPKDLNKFEFLKVLTILNSSMKHIPDSICMLKHLKFLKLKHCWHLEKLPEDLGHIECLETINLSYIVIKQLPDSICMLKHLKFLYIGRCALLEKLPEDLDRLENLVCLTVLGCTSLGDIPERIYKMKCLKGLHV